MLSYSIPAKELLLKRRRSIEERETEVLHPKASLSQEHSRYFGREEDHRLPYKRDVDRIVHSKAFSRYVDKTQVAYLISNDHIAHRSLHVQLVSNFARGIAEILRLNLDLVEAIALGHDVGHSPFGHEGEVYLSQLSQEYGNGLFTHPLQSCRLFMEVEPLNLGLAVYDGFLCHDGGMSGTCLVPQYGKTWDDHFADKKQKKENPDGTIIPATLEGCLVKLCDTMSYLGRDIEDAISLGIIDREEVPQTFLGNSNREILNTLACVIIDLSDGKDHIEISDEAYEALKELRQFNFRRIYKHPKLKVESEKIERSYRVIFEILLNDLNEKGTKSYLGERFLENKPDSYLSSTTHVQVVVDYMAGMTDSHFIRTLNKLIVPSRIEMNHGRFTD